MKTEKDLMITLERYPHLVLYDDSCGMCQRSVQFLIQHNTKNNLFFASLESNIGQTIKKHFDMEDIDSIIYVKHQKAFNYANAIFESMKELKNPWKQFSFLKHIPQFISTPVYQLIAKNRKKLNKRFDNCPVYPPETRARFLNL